MIRDLPADELHSRNDARLLDASIVSGLADSIGSIGLINPIRVRAIADGWEVIAGNHRLAACKSLGLVDITCDVVEDDDIGAELAMIDENLCRSELSAALRAKYTARRRSIYQELHPETGRGGDRKTSNFQGREFGRTPSFVEQTASATGASEISVYREASRGDNILPEVLDMIVGTKLDSGLYLDNLKKLPASEQYEAASRDLASEKRAERIAASEAEHQFKTLMTAWRKASKSVRAEFLAKVT